MDTKQIADKLDYFQVDLNTIQDLHASDFMYFSNWMRDLDKKVGAVDAAILKLQKTQQFADATKAVAPKVVEVYKLPKLKIALAIGVGVYVGVKVNEALKPKKEK